MIRPANIYYMLAYAFRDLNEQDRPRSLSGEEFENAADLCAAILAEGLKKQVRRGIRKGYVPQRAALSALRGRLDWPATIRTGGQEAGGSSAPMMNFWRTSRSTASSRPLLRGL